MEQVYFHHNPCPTSSGHNLSGLSPLDIRYDFDILTSPSPLSQLAAMPPSLLSNTGQRQRFPTDKEFKAYHKMAATMLRRNAQVLDGELLELAVSAAGSNDRKFNTPPPVPPKDPKYIPTAKKMPKPILKVESKSSRLQQTLSDIEYAMWKYVFDDDDDTRAEDKGLAGLIVDSACGLGGLEQEFGYVGGRQEHEYVMSGALADDDDRCALGDKCKLKRRGGAAEVEDGRAEGKGRREKGKARVIEGEGGQHTNTGQVEKHKARVSVVNAGDGAHEEDESEDDGEGASDEAEYGSSASGNVVSDISSWDEGWQIPKINLEWWIWWRAL